MVAATALFTGCSEFDSGGGDADGGNRSTETPTDIETEIPTETPSPSPSPTAEEPADEKPTNESSSVYDVQVKIVYDGRWQGSLTIDDTSRSIDGEGTTTLDVPNDMRTVSVKVQKQNNSNRKLTVQILNDSNVIIEVSTNSPDSVAKISYTVG